MTTTRTARAAFAAASLLIPSLLSFVHAAHAAPARADLRGRILLQVQGKGEAWYVSPADGARLYLRRPADAFAVMRSQGVGITNNDIWKLPMGYRDMKGADTDGDGLADAYEDAIGTDRNKKDTDGDSFDDKTEILTRHNPYSATDVKLTGDDAFARANAGRIFLQVEGKGEAWWVNPNDHRRYFLGRPSDAYDLMRGLGLGITNADLEKIDVSAKSVPLPKPGESLPPVEGGSSSASSGSGDQSDAPVVANPASPIGTGYVMILAQYPIDPNADQLIWGRFTERGSAIVTEYVDDVTKMLRRDFVFGDHRYSTYVGIDGNVRKTLNCRYLPGEKGTCFRSDLLTEAGSTLLRIFPSTSPRALDYNGADAKTDSRTVAGYSLPCYTDGDSTLCYYDDLLSMPAYARAGGVTREMQTLIIGRPDAAAVTPPTDFTPLDPNAGDTVTSSRSAIGSGYIQTAFYKPVDMTAEYKVWDRFVEKGIATEVTTVDDVAKTWVRSMSGSNGRYVEYRDAVQNGVQPVLRCRFPTGGGKPQCAGAAVTVGAGAEGRVFPSDSPLAATELAEATLGEDRHTEAYGARCYVSGDETSCYYNDLYAMRMYAKTPAGTLETDELTIERPNATAFEKPAQYDPWP